MKSASTKLKEAIMVCGAPPTPLSALGRVRASSRSFTSILGPGMDFEKLGLWEQHLLLIQNLFPCIKKCKKINLK